MQLKTKQNIAKVIFISYCVFLLVWGGYWAYENVLEPAYISTVDGCGLKTTEEIADMGYTIYGRYFPKNDSIVMYVPDNNVDSYKKTATYKRGLKHELCHKNQSNNSRLSSCSNNVFGFPGARMLDEMECYFMNYF